MAATEVILREKIHGLGAEADVVKVKAGFARNFLIPTGKAYEATKGNLNQIENLNKARAAREAAELAEAHELAGKIGRLKPKFTLEIGANGKAFGSVTSIDTTRLSRKKDSPSTVPQSNLRSRSSLLVRLMLRSRFTLKFPLP